MKKLLFFTALAGSLIACSKDKFKTVPQVEVISLGPSEVLKGQLITFRGNVTDKEGDVQDSVIFYRKVYAVSGSLVSTDSSIRGTIKDFGIPAKTQEFELQLMLLYGQIDPSYPIQNGNNTVDRLLSVGVYVKDKAGNRSEYVESGKITLKKI